MLEAGLLEGAVLQNQSLVFSCKPVQLRVVNNETSFTSAYNRNEQITIPIAHGYGNYYCDESTLERLQNNNQIVFSYADENPNGSIANIAGIVNEKGNVFGMMPHPERAVEALLGSADGEKVFYIHR